MYLQCVILGDNPLDAVRRYLYEKNPDPMDFGKYIVVSERGFLLEKHHEDNDVTFPTKKTLKDLGYYNESET
jgi:hypothetical protein